MKSYICAILLLMCVMAHSTQRTIMPATQIGENACLFGNKVYPIGGYTAPGLCMWMICDTNGQISFQKCPRMTCNPGWQPMYYQPETVGKPFPDCCYQPICEPIRRQNEPYALPQLEFD